MVFSELGVHVLQRSVSVGLWLLDAVLVGLLGLVVGGMVLGLGHFTGVSLVLGRGGDAMGQLENIRLSM